MAECVFVQQTVTLYLELLGLWSNVALGSVEKVKEIEAGHWFQSSTAGNKLKYNFSISLNPCVCQTTRITPCIQSVSYPQKLLTT